MHVGYILLPAVVGAFFYMALAVCVWPYARPILPLWILLFAIFVPPLFPLVLWYVLVVACFLRPAVAPVEQPVIVVVREEGPAAPRTAVATRRQGRSI